MRKLWNKAAIAIFLVFVSRPGFAETNLAFSNTNFINSYKNPSGRTRVYDYNRLRADFSMKNTTEHIRVKGILDFETYLSRNFLNTAAFDVIKKADPKLPFNPYTGMFKSNAFAGRCYLYRIYTELRSGRDDLILGLQRVPFGVGRLWTPTDTFNPVNALRVEAEERLGVFAINYTRHLTDFSSWKIISDFAEKMTVDKYGLRYKGYHQGIDMGVTYLQNADFQMAGVEAESNLLDTGVEVRSELGFFEHDDLNKRYFSGILGLEYAFPKNITVLTEYFYNGLGNEHKNEYDRSILINGNWNLSRHYLGLILTGKINALTGISLPIIYNIGDSSLFGGAAISYSISDEATFNIGTNIFTGSTASEFAGYDNLYYLKFVQYF
ncbi:MAG: hypothetical protein ABH952_04910 [Candidatus Omnitrophota bacterium]